MQFVANGPDIPDELLQAHEEGRVVFFCGAGISYPAGLPGFGGLVEKIYALTSTVPTLIEKDALDRRQFDAALDLLEHRLPGGRLAVRRALARALLPKMRRKGATETHSALLRLARSREGSLRLVTTNFDRLFDKAARRSGQRFHSCPAPALPIPKNSRWDGLVYLHGRLPERDDDTALNRLVVTSGDFGLAYLTERWAARFVSELFRNYVVCFVGYSISDPVLRYMMDALAADRMLGESTPSAWALGDCQPGGEAEKTIEWKAKGVSPILYEVPTGSYDHSALHKTFHAWAETYRDGVLGKERIVVSHALARPSASTRQDDFVGRMLWALSDSSGRPAKRFADFTPAPSLEWLTGAFAEPRYQHSDLSRFSVPAHKEVDPKLRFSLVQRPASYALTQPMLLVCGDLAATQWDAVMHHLGRWLVRHLNDSDLFLWFVQRGGQLHERLLWLIEGELDRIDRLEREGKQAELDEIRANAPNAIPGTLMRTLWCLLLAGRSKSPHSEPDVYRWREHLRRCGLTATARMQLRALLMPMVSFKKAIRWGDEAEAADEIARIRKSVDWEVVLAADHVHTAFREGRDERWEEALPALLMDFQQLLRDALDLQRELHEADDRNDRSFWDMPSISPHWQNRNFHDWVTLIELLRDSWLLVRQLEPERSARIAKDWFELPYPTFKRMALFAASQDGSLPAEVWIAWLEADRAWWLWSNTTMREVLRLLVLQGQQLTPPVRERLEIAIMAGPPREMYRDDIELEQWNRIVARGIWLRLAKLASVATLGDVAAAHLADLSAAYPGLQLAANERDEFSHWMSGTGDPDFGDDREIDIAPRTRLELVEWLRKPVPDRSPFYEDTWLETCRTRFFPCLFALGDLATEGTWPVERWRAAIQTWSEEGRVVRSWNYAAQLVLTMPDPVLGEITHAVTWWLEAVSNVLTVHEATFFDLCRRVLLLPLDDEATQDGEADREPVTAAINHPIGHVTQALLNVWLKAEPNDNERLPPRVEPFFTQLCDDRALRFRHGRVVLASRLIALFRVDRPWTQAHLLPLFDWMGSRAEAKAAWEGFLWSPRLYRPLMGAFKPQFLATARHYDALGDHGRQFAGFLTYAALDPGDTFTAAELRTALGELPQEGLQESARALSQALEGAGAQREDYWRNRVLPFWQDIWPKLLDRASSSIAESLSRMTIAAGAEFPAALAAVENWLQAIDHPHFVVHQLFESGLCRRFPADSLQLLSRLINDQRWPPRELGQCLEAVAQAAPALAGDVQYQRLLDYVRDRTG